jgi:hypothetical protein
LAKDNSVKDNPIVVFTTENGAEVSTGLDGGSTPSAKVKGEVTEGPFRVSVLIRWPGLGRMGWPSGGFSNGLIASWDSFKHEMWCFQRPGELIAEYLPSIAEYPPMQTGANFSIQNPKEKVEAARKAAAAGNQ